MKKENKIKSQNGRSMVEMLGVLAIIGVLSVGGIMGYQTAMEKKRATDVIYVLNAYTPEMIRIVKESTLREANNNLSDFVHSNPFSKDFSKYAPDGHYSIIDISDSEIVLHVSSPAFKEYCKALVKHVPTTPSTSQIYIEDPICQDDETAIAIVIPY